MRISFQFLRNTQYAILNMDEYLYSFNRYLKNKFGQRVHRISLDAGFSCPNIDGTLSSAGCIFCNNRSFSRFAGLSGLALEEQITRGLDYAKARFKAKKYIAYFQSFSNTYADINFLKKQYTVIRKFNDFVGLAISTRPDCIDGEKLDLIESFTEDYEVYLEYGLQTIHDKTLKLINRKHTFRDFESAVELTALKSNINIAAHVILGLPGETKEDMLATAKVLAKMPIWGIKFHVLHVVKDTALAKMYAEGKASPVRNTKDTIYGGKISNGVNLLFLDEYADILVSFLEILPKTCVVLRLVSDARQELLLAPAWVNDKHRALGKIAGEFKRRRTYQGALARQ